MIENNNFDRIEELVKEAVEIVKGKPDDISVDRHDASWDPELISW